MEYRLADIFELQMGKTPDRNNPNYWKDGTEEWISISDLSKCDKYIEETSECISKQATENSGIKVIPENTVIMSFKLSIGKVAITPKPMYSNEAIMAFIDKGIVKIDSTYLFYLLMQNDWDSSTNKAVMGKTLNKTTLSQVKIRVHKIEEQQKIAKTLEKTRSIINARKQQLSELDILIKARFVEMFGDMIHTYNKWDKKTLGEVCDVRDGTHDSPQYVAVGYPLVTSKNVTTGKIDFNDCNLISKEDFDKINIRSKVDIGDVLMPMIGTVGNPVIVDIEAEFAIKNVALIKFKPQTKVLNIFVKTLLQSDYFDRVVIDKLRGGTQKFISLGDIRNLEILLPPIELQTSFSKFIAQINKSKVAVQKSLDETQMLFDSLMQEYFG